MKIGIVTNTGKDMELAYTREVAAFLQTRGVEPVLAEPIPVESALTEPSMSINTVVNTEVYTEVYTEINTAVNTDAAYRDVSFIVALGGDGTMLRASHKAALYDTPMLGINLGRLGYLTDVEQHEGLAALDKLLTGAYRRERRMMLTVASDANGITHRWPTADTLALNDVCLSRGGFGKLISFDLFINGLYMDSLRADGVIVATPTGSTAYNLSAGGPILSPDGEMMVVTAVCPHALYTRPWVISANDEVTIRAADENAAVVLDGEMRFPLRRGESVRIRRAAQTATIIKTSPMNFYEILRQKMGQESVMQTKQMPRA